jgi:hypothetical protein
MALDQEKIDTSPSPTITSADETKAEKSASDASHGSSSLSRTPSALDSHAYNAEGYGRASDVESQRPSSLYPVTSYASQIGGEGTFEDDEPEAAAGGERDPNLVEWDGPEDPHNPYNWY